MKNRLRRLQRRDQRVGGRITRHRWP
jgi:hypothetical protein